MCRGMDCAFSLNREYTPNAQSSIHVGEGCCQSLGEGYVPQGLHTQSPAHHLAGGLVMRVPLMSSLGGSLI